MTAAPDDRAARAARSGLAVAASVLVTLGAHLAGGGSAPAPVLVVAVVALAWPAGLLLVGRRSHLLRQLAVVGLAQGMLHALFAAGGGTGTAVAAASTGMPGMHDPVLPASLPPMHHGGAMWWAHVLAGLVVVAAWRRGEAVLRHLLAPALVRRALALLAPLPARARSAARPRTRIREASGAVLLAAHRDRGPPRPA